jgi:hypothetical protein
MQLVWWKCWGWKISNWKNEKSLEIFRNFFGNILKIFRIFSIQFFFQINIIVIIGALTIMLYFVCHFFFTKNLTKDFTKNSKLFIHLCLMTGISPRCKAHIELTKILVQSLNAGSQLMTNVFKNSYHCTTWCIIHFPPLQIRRRLIVITMSIH